MPRRDRKTNLEQPRQKKITKEVVDVNSNMLVIPLDVNALNAPVTKVLSRCKVTLCGPERKLTYPSSQGARGQGAAPCFLVLCSSSPTQSNQTQSLSTEQPTACWVVSEFGTYRWVKTKFLSLLILNEEQVRFSRNSWIHPFSRGLGSPHNFMVVVVGVRTILRTLVKKVPPVSPECPPEWDLGNTGGRVGGGTFLNGNSSMCFCLPQLSTLLFQ